MSPVQMTEKRHFPRVQRSCMCARVCFSINSGPEKRWEEQGEENERNSSNVDDHSARKCLLKPKAETFALIFLNNSIILPSIIARTVGWDKHLSGNQKPKRSVSLAESAPGLRLPVPPSARTRTEQLAKQKQKGEERQATNQQEERKISENGLHTSRKPKTKNKIKEIVAHAVRWSARVSVTITVGRANKK